MSCDVEGTHPYKRLCEEDTVYEYDKLLRLKNRNCSGQRFFAICILASTVTLIVILLCLFAGNDDKWVTSISNTIYDISVSTTCGRVKGELTGDGFIFKGIPYALPPTGENRWQFSTPLMKNKGCWHGKRRNKKFGNKCFQKNPLTGKLEGDENCLFLNVWTPTLDSESSLPVVVYIHGGNFQWGSGHELALSPEIALAHEYNIIVVTFNYRLSVFGFLSLDIPSTERNISELTGNYGLHDQILALKWVRENIKNFGGDPNKVTLFGQGSGATCALALIASNRAKGLFQRLWLSSPKNIDYLTLQEAKKLNENFLHETNCSDIDCLWDLQPQQVLDTNSFFRIVIDGDIVTDKVENLLRNDLFNDVPILIGSTAQQDQIEFAENADKWNLSDFIRLAVEQIPELNNSTSLQRFTNLYFNNTSNPQVNFLSAFTDKNSICYVNALSEHATVISSPIYRYVITGQLSQIIQLPFTKNLAKYSFPMIDLIGFFGLFSRFIKEPNDQDLQLQENIQSMAIDFIRCGAMQMSSWKPYNKTVVEISSELKLVSNYHKEKCQFWNQLG